MIVDEVDSLIVDENAYQSYVYDDHAASEVCQWWYGEGQSADTKTIEGLEAWMQKIINKMKDADNDARMNKFEGKHFQIDEATDKLVALDEKTSSVKRNAWFLWLEALKKQRDPEHRIEYKCRQMVVCQKSCFTSYSFIFGLTGSLGTKAELEYTKKQFHASCFYVPPFLDTCQGMTRPQPKKVSTYVGNNTNEQLVKAVEVVKQNIEKVPVLVVVTDQDRVKQMTPALEKALPKHAAGDKLGPGVIALIDMPGKEAEFQQLVETATIPITIDGKKQWRVTVTTAVGARGQDYQISDDVVDRNGGLLLVLEYIPDSEREWIQFLGRTARHDHPGQYAVILNRTDYKDSLGGGAQHEGADVERQVLDHINKITAEKIGEAELQLEKGTVMHENTSSFWTWYANSKAEDKEKFDKFFKWVDLCDDFPDMTLESITGAFEALRAGSVKEKVLPSTKLQFRANVAPQNVAPQKK